MNISESLKSAFISLKGNKMRSFLTMLGIIIGISSVIAMSAIGKGAQDSITRDLKESGYGKFNVTILPSVDNFRRKYMFDDDIIRRLRETGEFNGVSQSQTSQLINITDNQQYFFITSPSDKDFEKIEPIKMSKGRYFLDYELENIERVIIIDTMAAKQIYGGEQEAIGQTIELSQGRNGIKHQYTIVGISVNPAEKLMGMAGGGRPPMFARIPLNVFNEDYSVDSTYNTILVQSKNPDNLASDMAKMKVILAEMTGEDDLFQVSSMSNAIASFDSILGTINLFVSFVAGISLFVGGIGVMNIMLVSVIERTKEIGIRKAIGATNNDILVQFLMESVILTGIGGIIGLVIGIAFAIAVGKFIDFPPTFTTASIVTAIAVSTLIGIVFGVAPAKKAAELNPIDALRAE